MTDEPHSSANTFDLLAQIDPWVALQDGRRQLLAALEACDPRSGARMLAIPEFAAIGETTGTLLAMLAAHAARDRAHAGFFESLDAPGGIGGAAATITIDIADWDAVRAEIDAARFAMLEAAGNLRSDRWEETLRTPWDPDIEDSVTALLVVRAMADGMLADAILALSVIPPEGPRAL
ncbi:MAG: hypothetical protein EPO65_06095 [Dehalococcoidia bacterium]|nr:MAG: hypothetical protein EPO65_06095 [Dehalococcoidia bacterium]